MYNIAINNKVKYKLVIQVNYQLNRTFREKILSRTKLDV